MKKGWNSVQDYREASIIAFSNRKRHVLSFEDFPVRFLIQITNEKLYWGRKSISEIEIGQNFIVLENRRRSKNETHKSGVWFEVLKGTYGKDRQFVLLMSYNNDSVAKMPLIQNVVAFAKVEMDSEKLCLSQIVERIQGCRLNRRRFPAVIMRKAKPKSTILVFESGRLIIIGSESQSDAEKAAKIAVRDISKAMNNKFKLADFRVTNLVANASFGFRIYLQRLCEEPNIQRNQNFPGVVIKNLENVKTAMLFSTGKIIFTGAQKKDDIDRAYMYLAKKLANFKKNT